MEFDATEIPVSIIIPFFNVEDKIHRILACLRDQTDKNFELILVNDGSSDNSLHILNKNINDIICRSKRVINQNNQGPAIARNVGLKYAKGIYVYFPDADDIISKRLVEFLVLSLRKLSTPTDILSFGFDISKNVKVSPVDPGLEQLEDSSIKQYLDSATKQEVGFGYLWNKFIRRRFIENNDLRFGHYKYDEDAIFLTQAYQKAHSFMVSETRLYQYIVYSNSLSHSKRNYSQSVRSLSKLNQLTDELCDEYGLQDSGLQVRIRLRLIFAIARGTKSYTADEISRLKYLIKSIASASEFVFMRDQLATLYLKLFGTFGLRVLVRFM